MKQTDPIPVPHPHWHIRQAAASDMPALLGIYDHARAFMRSYGNFAQWVGGYPSQKDLENDIRRGCLYVCEDLSLGGNRGKFLLGAFAFVPGPDPTYARIENGRWPDEKPYCVLHRIASAPGVKGLADYCFDWCLRQHPVLRIDTHADNRPMLHLMEKNGFVRCGIIHVADGSPRVAFQKESRPGEAG